MYQAVSLASEHSVLIDGTNGGVGNRPTNRRFYVSRQVKLQRIPFNNGNILATRLNPDTLDGPASPSGIHFWLTFIQCGLGNGDIGILKVACLIFCLHLQIHQGSRTGYGRGTGKGKGVRSNIEQYIRGVFKQATFYFYSNYFEYGFIGIEYEGTG